MNSRRLVPSDFKAVQDIHERHHDFELVEPNYDFGTIIVENKGKVIGAGYLRPLLEPVMVLDLDASLRDKVTALRIMNNQAVVDARSLSQTELRAWAKNPNYVQSLIKHLGYEVLEGTSMRLRI